MHDHQTGVNMTYLTMKEYKLTPSLQFMVLNNWYKNQPTYFPILHHVLTWFSQKKTNLVIGSGTHFSLHPNCRHHIIHYKINLQVEYPPLYQKHVWNYAKVNKDTILSAFQNVNWHRLFANFINKWIC